MMNTQPNLSKTQLLTPEFIQKLRESVILKWNGMHGAGHWARVRLNGLILAELNGADKSVIEYFAFLHDLRRFDDGYDPEHGLRAAEFAKTKLRSFIHLSPTQFDLLIEAMEGHTHGENHQNITIATCWDADRLDLLRCGITPDPNRLCTDAAKNQNIISDANARAVSCYKPK